MPVFEKKTTREILHLNQQRQPPPPMQHLQIWLHNIRSLHNVGAAFRCCDALGAAGLLLSGYTPRPPRPEISKTALGAEQSVPWEYIANPLPFMKERKAAGTRLYGIEQTHDSLPIAQLLPETTAEGVPVPVMLFFGNEVSGLDEAFLPHMHACYEIPQFGQKHSLNVSVTIGIVLYHVLARSLV
ncbi:MAG: TrmH family RNA methyltransferase [Cyclonatronaceae bacterium]